MSTDDDKALGPHSDPGYAAPEPRTAAPWATVSVDRDSEARARYAAKTGFKVYDTPWLHTLDQIDGKPGWYSVHVHYATPDATGCERLAHEPTATLAWEAAKREASLRYSSEGHTWLHNGGVIGSLIAAVRYAQRTSRPLPLDGDPSIGLPAQLGAPFDEVGTRDLEVEIEVAPVVDPDGRSDLQLEMLLVLDQVRRSVETGEWATLSVVLATKDDGKLADVVSATVNGSGDEAIAREAVADLLGMLERLEDGDDEDGEE